MLVNIFTPKCVDPGSPVVDVHLGNILNQNVLIDFRSNHKHYEKGEWKI